MFRQYDALIRYWLHDSPAEEMERWVEQIAQALWIEERFFKAYHNKGV